MNKSLSFFLKTFITLSCLIALLVGVSWVLFLNTFLSYSQTQIGESRMINARGAEKHLAQLNDSLSRDAMHLSLLIQDAYISTSTAAKLTDQAPNSLQERYYEFKYMRNIYTILLHTVQSNPRFCSIYLYLTDKDYVVSSDSEFATLSEFSEIGWVSATSDDANSWIDTRIVFPHSMIKTQNQGRPTYQRVITYVHKISSFTTPFVEGYLVFNIFEEHVSSLINDSNAADQERMTIISNDGMVISDTNKEYIGANITQQPYIQEILGGADDEGFFLSDIDNTPVMVSYYKSGLNDWVFVEYLPFDQMSGKVQAISIQMASSTIIIFGVGIIIALLISRFLYSPLKQLTETILKNENLALTAPSDLELIKKALNYLMAEEEHLRRTLSQSEKSMADRALHDLLTEGIYPEGEDSALLKRFEAPGNICICISDDRHVSALHKKDKQERFYLRNLLVHLCIESVKTDTEIVHSNLFFRNEIIIILHFPRAVTPEVYDEIVQKLGGFAKNADKSLKLSCSIGVSAPFEGVQAAHTEYLRSVAAVEMKLFKGYASVTRADEVPCEGKYFFPIAAEKRLLSDLETWDVQRIRASLAGVFNEIKTHKSLTVSNAMLIVHLLVGNMVKNLTQSDLKDDILLAQARHMLNRSYFSSFATLEELETYITDEFLAAIERTQKNRESSGDLYERMRRYIDANFTQDLGIDRIAAHLGISYSYTRRIFKENSDKNILDYINERRVALGKQLLCETDKSVSEIAIELGYNNDQSFTRYFKNIAGTSPGKYRKLNARDIFSAENNDE